MLVCPYLEQYKLESLSEEYELPEREAHDALEDVRMTIDVAACLLEEVFSDDDDRMPAWAVDRLEELD